MSAEVLEISVRLDEQFEIHFNFFGGLFSWL